MDVTDSASPSTTLSSISDKDSFIVVALGIVLPKLSYYPLRLIELKPELLNPKLDYRL